MTAPIARLENARVSFGRREVLHGLNWEINQGEFWGLIGPNGAGKSTLLGLFNAMTPLTAGAVYFNEEKITPKTLQKVRTKIAHVFQMLEVDPRIPVTVYEAVLAGTYAKLGLFHRPGKEEMKLAYEALEATGLLDMKDAPLGRISGGQKQRTAIARALAQKPTLMLLDEPTAALDWQAQRDILNLIGQLQRSMGLTVVMATHDLNAVSHITTHTAILKDGALIQASKTEDAMSSDVLTALYETPVDIVEHKGRKVALF